jgi:hypothetical protein
MSVGDNYGSGYNIEKITLTYVSCPIQYSKHLTRLSLSLFTFSRTALQDLIEKAAHEHRARDLAEIQIHIGDQ